MRSRHDDTAKAGTTIEWPTVALICAVHFCIATLTWYWSVLPWWLALPAAGYLTGLYGGLQHEVIHGHPTRWHALNAALVFPALLLWVPFERYREQHLTHHRDELLTDPYDDPESYYVASQEWARLTPATRILMRANNTLAGRLLIGPFVAMARFWTREARLIVAGDADARKAWLLHLPALAIVLAWTWGVCGISPVVFAAAFAYPGTALIMLRSYAEHRAHEHIGARSVVVETCPALSLLFLNNNLHALHHERPGMPWYRLPRTYRAERDAVLQGNEGYLIAGYGKLFMDYLLMPKEPVAHPLSRRPAGAPQAETVRR